MRDDSTMVAIEAALRSAGACLCGNALDIAAHDGALWLECPSFAAPTRLPARLARELRALAHSRMFVAPERVTGEPATRSERTLPASRRAVAGAEGPPPRADAPRQGAARKPHTGDGPRGGDGRPGLPRGVIRACWTRAAQER